MDCCRAIRDKERKNLDDDFELLKFLNAENLVDRYIQLSMAKKENLANFQPPIHSKTMKEEYDDDHKKRQLEIERAHAQMILECENKTRYQPTDPFGCSLNNTFRIHVSLLNSQTYFP